MVWEWKCHSIVMLTELQEREQVSCVAASVQFTQGLSTDVCVCVQDKCCQYWPAEETATYGDYTVELKGDTLCDTFSLRDLVLTFVPVRKNQRTAGASVRITSVFCGISEL